MKKTFFIAMLMAAAVLGASSCARKKVSPVITDESGASILWYSGHVDDVINGRVPEAAKQPISASRFAVGFEAGSPEGLESLGEFIAVNGTAYARSTDPSSPAFYDLITGPSFYTTGAIYVPHEARPSMRLADAAEPSQELLTLEKLYEHIYESTGRVAYCFAGEIHFANCASIAVARAPIYGEVIFDNREAYYPYGTANDPDVVTVVMGCGANFADESDPTRRADLGRVLYDNPYDTGSGLSTHAHALLLNEGSRHASWKQVRPDHAEQVVHLLSQSTIIAYDLEIYPIQHLEPLPAE